MACFACNSLVTRLLVNVGRAGRFIAAGRMHAAGLASFNARPTAKTEIYAFERKQPAKLPSTYRKKFCASQAASAFFNVQPPSNRRTVLHFVVSARQEATRLRRLDLLMAESTAGRRLSAFKPRKDQDTEDKSPPKSA